MCNGCLNCKCEKVKSYSDEISKLIDMMSVDMPHHQFEELKSKIRYYLDKEKEI